MNPLPSSQAAFLNSNIENIISAINDKRKRDISLLAGEIPPPMPTHTHTFMATQISKVT